MSTRHQWDNGHRPFLLVKVKFPEYTDLSVPSMFEGEGKPMGIERSNYLTMLELILHKHMEAAISEIGQLDLKQGGYIAKDWPLSKE
jgi:hypothetical protein